MHGHLSHDTLVEVPAAVIWDVSRGIVLGRLLNELLQDVLGRFEVVEGNGGVGTIVKITFPPGSSGPSYMKEMFTKIDDENRVKEAEVIEGGYKELGFDLCRYRLQIIEKDVESSVIRSSMEYEIDDKLGEIASHVSIKPMKILAEAIGKYLQEKRISRN